MLKRVTLLTILSGVLVFCAPGVFGEHPDGGGIGLIAGTGYGSWDFAGVSPGITWKFGGVPVFWGFYTHIKDNYYGLGISGDCYFIDSFLARKKNLDLDWFAGAGGYAGIWFYGNGPSIKKRDELRLNTGVRIPGGITWHIREEWELFGELVPVIGISILPTFARFYWDLNIEIGARYWF